MPSTAPSPDPAPAPRVTSGAGRPARPGRVVDRSTGWSLLVAGAAGLLAAFILSVEKYRLAVDPGYVTSCDLNPVVSCGSIMDTTQASALGVPNSLIGVAAFAVVVTVAAALLAGFTPPGWFWAGLLTGATAGLVFVLWLIGQSLYVIGALCPYCMLVWLATATVFWVTTLTVLDWQVTGPRARRTVEVLRGYRPVPIVLFATVVVVLVTVRFWDYWRTLL